MAKKPKPPPLPTLEEQLHAHDATEPPGPTVGALHDAMLQVPSPERVVWAKKRLSLAEAIGKRDRGRDADLDKPVGGNFGPTAAAQRLHRVDVAPKSLDKLLPKDSQFPKRIVTQRMIDRYLAHRHISQDEWKAAEMLLQFWMDKEMQAKTTSGYDPVMVQSSPNMDGRLAKYLDAALGYTRLMKAVPYHCQGVVMAVVIEDRSASDWARRRGYGRRDSERLGMERLRQGLSALAGCADG
jgi:hypothetical protein